MSQNVAYHFYTVAMSNPDRLALREGADSMTYGQLLEEVQQTAAYFRRQGIEPGDRVLVAVPMGMDLYRVVLALFFTGATAVFLDEWVSFRRMEMCCAIAQCKGFIGNRKARFVRLLSRELRKIPVNLSPGKRGPRMAMEPEAVPAESVALMTFTTGSTGTPKAANRTHGFLNTQFQVLRGKIGGSARDHELTNLPIVLLINLGVGSCSLIGHFKAKKPDKTDFSELFRQINEAKVNRLVVSPYFLIRLCAYMQQQRLALPDVRQVFTGGGPLFPEEAKQIVPFFPAARLEVVYGSTEAEPISSIEVAELATYCGQVCGLPVGMPDPHAEVRIIPIHDGEVVVGPEGLPELQPGEIGEIVVSGPHVLKSYFNNPEANRLVKIRVGDRIYHRTGDSGYLNEEGALFLTGRCAQVIERDERQWYPLLVEQQLAALDGVVRGAVVGNEDRMVCFVQLQAGVDRAAAEAELRSTGIPFTDIQRVAFLPTDPRHHTKVDYAQLERLAGFTS